LNPINTAKKNKGFKVPSRIGIVASQNATEFLSLADEFIKRYHLNPDQAR